jgi:hypothetical protein
MMTPDERRAKRNEAIRNRGTWRPTPSQEECDLAAAGVPNNEIEKVPDGSPLDKHVERNREVTREMHPEKDPRGGYKTK